MKYLNKKLIITTFAIIIIGAGAWLSYINGTFLPFIEKIINENPEAKINVYIQAVAKGDKIAALSAWEISSENNPLKERRDKITAELINAEITSKFSVANIEWWGTCCVPAIINNPRAAGGARVDIELTDNNGNKHSYIFDVFASGGYEGAAVGYPVRHWVLRDVYKTGDKPLFWTWKNGAVYTPLTRFLAMLK